jgi:hypothetical protein
VWCNSNDPLNNSSKTLLIIINAEKNNRERLPSHLLSGSVDPAPRRAEATAAMKRPKGETGGRSGFNRFFDNRFVRYQSVNAMSTLNQRVRQVTSLARASSKRHQHWRPTVVKIL